MAIFYSPADATAGDVIPFYWDGHYHLFFLKETGASRGHGFMTSWQHVVTRDFLSFEDWGEAIPRGDESAQDLWAYTGSIIERRGRFHCYYTGHNPHFTGPEHAMEAVMHATSTDLRTWEKDPTFHLYPPVEYEQHDWRDPFVLFHEPTGEYWMLVTTRKASGPMLHRGCIALATSLHLDHWEVQNPLWDPEEQFAHECPDLFRIGEWWYLIYSSFGQTRYRMSRSPKGPWLAPESDALDGRAYYAGKTVGDGRRRYLFGWLPTRAEEKDTGRWQWGGHIVIHEIKQQSDGSLAVRVPSSIVKAFSQPTVLTPWPVLGEWVVEEDLIAAYALGRFSALTLGGLPEEGLFQTTLTYAPGTKSCGLLLHATEDFSYYQLLLEPGYQRMAITRRPGGQPVILERPLAMQAGKPITLKVIVDGSSMVIYANDQVALSFRGYDFRQGLAGFYVQEGEASFTDFSISVRPGIPLEEG
ncbi:MAG: hypothetical protein ACYC7E_12535 [Armatimonadota bacterium]